MPEYQARYIPLAALAALRDADAPAQAKTAAFAQACRVNCLYMIQKAGSGHIGTSFSSLDIMAWLHLSAMNPEDVFFSSKGHDAPALYTVLLALGRLDFDLIHRLRRLDGLPGHPDVRTPGMATNTGSLGMGISKARGMAKARRLDGKKARVFVLLGDGELQEGQIYESLQPTVNGNYGEITAIVDHNKIQSDTWVSDVSDLGDLEAKFAAFGWATARCPGNDVAALARTLDGLEADNPDKPKLLIADTIKGKGVSFMEDFDAQATGGQYAYHSGAIAPEAYEKALAELLLGLETACRAADIPMPELISTQIETATPAPNPQKLIPAYGQTLLDLGDKHQDLVVLDGDLALDCGIIPFREAHPDRFVECGIAEMDMVSMAGGLALSGKLPVVHSFSCFLSTRPNEQIFNNATEHTKIIYAGSLAGVLPSGPGHSHQSSRDIALMGSVPGMTCIQPCCETETRLALTWAVEQNPGSTYVRLTTIPCVIDFDLPQGYGLEPGKGCVLRDGRDVVLLGYGPVMLQQAYLAAGLLEEQGISLKVVNLPWLKPG